MSQGTLEVIGVGQPLTILYSCPVPELRITMYALWPEQRVCSSSTVHIASCLKMISALPPPRQDSPSASRWWSFSPPPPGRASPSLCHLNILELSLNPIWLVVQLVMVVVGTFSLIESRWYWHEANEWWCLMLGISEMSELWKSKESVLRWAAHQPICAMCHERARGCHGYRELLDESTCQPGSQMKHVWGVWEVAR